jgi:hypothetical protein
VFMCLRFSVQVFPSKCSSAPDKVFKWVRNMQYFQWIDQFWWVKHLFSNNDLVKFTKNKGEGSVFD